MFLFNRWCGHCKKAKPEYSGAAEELKGNNKVKLGAVDCTQEQGLCKTFDIRGYPTFKYFSFYDKKQKDYDGGRKKADFVRFLKDPSKAAAPPVCTSHKCTSVSASWARLHSPCPCEAKGKMLRRKNLL